jgi:serine/threonine-protein kinase RsbW
MKTTIEISSRINNIRKVSAQILESLSAYRLDAGTLFDIRLCTEEAVRNAMVHGNKADSKLSVRVDYWIEDDRLNIEVEDEGPGFKPGDVPDPTCNSGLMKESGRGMRLIRELMDKVDFNGKGNKIIMEKVLR